MAESPILVDDAIDTDTLSTISTGESSNNIDVLDRNGEENEVNDDEVLLENNQERETTVRNHVPQTTNDEVLLKINEINSNIDRPWKVRGTISFKHPKRTYVNTNGTGEISTWDFSDETGSINIIAFNLHSNTMSNQLLNGDSYEISCLTIRPADAMYKNLPHDYVLVINNSTIVRDIEMNFQYQTSFNFVDLDEIQSLPLNSLIDVQVKVLRDYGLSTGYSNDTIWNRRDLHGTRSNANTFDFMESIGQKTTTSMVNKELKIKNIKVSWFGGSRTLVSLPNTQLQII